MAWKRFLPGHVDSPHKRPSNAERWCFLRWLAPTSWITNSAVAYYLRRHVAHVTSLSYTQAVVKLGTSHTYPTSDIGHAAIDWREWVCIYNPYIYGMQLHIHVLWKKIFVPELFAHPHHRRCLYVPVSHITKLFLNIVVTCLQECNLLFSVKALHNTLLLNRFRWNPVTFPLTDTRSLIFLAAASSSINTPCLSVCLSVTLCLRSPGCNSSQIMVKLGGGTPWAKISAKFVRWRCSSLNECLMS